MHDGRLPDGRSPILRTTRWSLIRRAIQQPEALDQWAAGCWYPLYTWARHKGWSPEDAADAVQEFLGKICAGQKLSQADPVRGRFRSWLLAGFQNHLADRVSHGLRLKRGGGAPHLSLDHEHAERFYLEEMATCDDAGRATDKAWALSLMDEAMKRLERHYIDTGRQGLVEHLLPAIEEPLPDGGYRHAARELGMTESAVRQAVFRMRGRYRLHLLEVAGEWLGIHSEAQLQATLKELLGGA